MSSQVIKAGLVDWGGGVLGMVVGEDVGELAAVSEASPGDQAVEMMKKARTIEEVEFYKDQADGAGRWLRR